ncbi:MAG: hypothetical protein U0M92_03615 [Bacilli bacterium]
MKKIIVSSLGLLIAVVGVITTQIIDEPRMTYEDKANQIEIIGVDQDESTDEVTEEKVEEKESIENVEEVKEKSENKSVGEEKSKSQSESHTPKSNTSVKSDKTKQEQTQNNNYNSSNTQNNTNVNTQNQSSSNKTTPSDSSEQKNVVSTTFYDSITHGQKEFKSESEAFARGTQIQQNELNAVLDYNELHPDNQIQPDINYFRVYPSAIDENGNYWYYLHFFCVSGEGQDSYLKSKY